MTRHDLDLLDEARDLLGHIPDPIDSFLEWLLVNHGTCLAAAELRCVLEQVAE